ncbi:MAG: DUF1211 domain-containing protein [Acidobacteria bacterium]|nr:DUF1211 domain-containing protein [Acidobacteriota bacterium]
MTTTRLEAFSDAVIAIIITIMVLDFRVPETDDWEALAMIAPTFLMYVLSFVFLAIYWNNHHHLLHATSRVSGGVLWANMHLLFWLSLVPFTTAWVGDSALAPVPTAVYGVVFLLASIGYWILVNTILAHEGPESQLRAAIGSDVKGKISIVIYATAIPLAFVNPMIAGALYITVAALWLCPDPRIERRIASR